MEEHPSGLGRVFRSHKSLVLVIPRHVCQSVSLECSSIVLCKVDGPNKIVVEVRDRDGGPRVARKGV